MSDRERERGREEEEGGVKGYRRGIEKEERKDKEIGKETETELKRGLVEARERKR